MIPWRRGARLANVDPIEVTVSSGTPFNVNDLFENDYNGCGRF